MKKSKKVLKWIGIVLLVIVILVVLFFGMLTITEFKPAAEEELEVNGTASETIASGDALTVMSWNIGYASLDNDADFFMDGGEQVITVDKDEVYENLDTILSIINENDPDITMLQECDRDSKRSKRVDEMEYLADQLTDSEYFFAYNYKTLYVPYPWPTLGRVQSGLTTFTNYAVTSAKRIALPCPFKYPVSLVNLKRCLEVSRIPVEGSDKELVIVNLHLEAYDSGEGKIAQTKQLKELLETEAAAGNYVIAAGDFNQAFSNIDNSAYPQQGEDMWMPGIIDVTEFGEGLTFLQDNTTPTCRSLDQPYVGADKENFQYYLIDGFIVSSNVNVESITTVDTDFVATDHNPVVLKATLD